MGQGAGGDMTGQIGDLDLMTQIKTLMNPTGGMDEAQIKELRKAAMQNMLPQLGMGLMSAAQGGGPLGSRQQQLMGLLGGMGAGFPGAMGQAALQAKVGQIPSMRPQSPMPAYEAPMGPPAHLQNPQLDTPPWMTGLWG